MAQPSTPPSPSDGSILVFDEATNGAVVVPAATIDENGNANFNSCSVQGQPVGGGAGNKVQATVDFGSDSGPITRVFDATVVVPASWVTATSIIVCSLAGVATTTHSVEDALLEGITVQVENIVPGTGFTLHAYSPKGSFGKYVFNVIGM